MGPSYFEAEGQAYLYFSSSSGAVPGDIFVSERLADGTYGPASAVAGLNSSGNDIQPNVRKDGLEVVLSSNFAYRARRVDRTSTQRRGATSPTPGRLRRNLGDGVNTAAGESRPSFTWDAQSLFFGRAPGPEGMSDIYLSTRDKISGTP